MNRTNKKRINLEDAYLDTLLRQEFDCTIPPSSELKNQLLVALQSRTLPLPHGLEGISLWWLPAASATIFTLAAVTVVTYFLSGSPFMIPLCAAMLLFCANTWLLTLIGLRLFNLKEAALI